MSGESRQESERGAGPHDDDVAGEIGQQDREQYELGRTRQQTRARDALKALLADLKNTELMMTLLAWESAEIGKLKRRRLGEAGLIGRQRDRLCDC